LVNTKAIGPKILEIATEAEESWDGYKEEYGRWGYQQKNSNKD